MRIFKNRTVIGIICILVALVICFGITPLFNRSISQKAEIVRVVKDIHAGELITKDMVTTAEVGSYNLPSCLMTEKNNVVGKYAKADFAVGDYILAAKLSEAPAAENAYLYNLDGSKQAISVTIKSFAAGLSGKLQSGDIVSVIVADYPEDGETIIPAELQYVEIISVTASSGYDANTGEATEDEKELPSTVTFLVLPEQAKVLAELEKDAKLHLTLVYRGTADGAKQFIEAQDALIVQAGDIHPIEVILPVGGHVQAPEHVHQGGLARARRAHNGHELALVDLEGHAVQGAHLALLALVIYFIDILNVDEHAASPQ